ncbi:WD-40 repeat family protein [Musa troglodytarum]|uniref:WD-40 repeat family protein n=1 Tax=Musa troglodytarum TaxID=320322 RepID=A0A9E7F865_9LILI|nr:WD-40 repeat family protein [Musa troglodytarum]URD89088.1 WD-40 repeat family protein [Musa troglodytarum]
MPIFDEGEDNFFDAYDEISTSIDSSSSDNSLITDQVLELRRIEYELWTKEPMSVDDRRKRFFRGMGFDELVHSPVGCSMDTQDSTIGSSEEKMDAKRIMTTSGVVLNSLSSPDVGEPEDSFCCIKDLDSGRQFMVHEFGRDGFPSMFKEVGSEKLMTLQEFEIFLGLSRSVQKLSRKDVVLFREKTICSHDTKKSNYLNWWRSFTKRRHHVGASNHNVSVKKTRLTRSMRTKVHRYRKNCMDFTALYMGQEIQGHKGLIRAMKFSPSGRYLASGGEDCVVRIWQIIEAEDSCRCVTTDGSSRFVGKVKGTKLVEGKASNVAPVFIPKRIFKIEESPLLELRGHTSDILDLSWSQSNCLLTSSKDKTGFVVGSIKGNCRFYDCSAKTMQIDLQLSLSSKKKSSGKPITGLQFCPEDYKRIMITSADSRIRICNGVDVILILKDGRHVVSVGEDSNVYIWSYDVSGNPPCRGAKLIRSSEFFFSKGASIAVPWPGMGCNYREAIVNNSNHISSQPQKISEQVFRLKNPDCCSLGTWPFSDGSSRVSATWPEEKLSLQTKPRLLTEDCHQHYHHLHHDHWSLTSMASTWNSVIVTAGDDGAIRNNSRNLRAVPSHMQPISTQFEQAKG